MTSEERRKARTQTWPAETFTSHAEADLADERQYKEMTPARRLEIAFELHNRVYGEYPHRLARLH
ncbi:hypothetical protein BH11ARM2_BH11ARM2_22260 [soil metagenome]